MRKSVRRVIYRFLPARLLLALILLFSRRVGIVKAWGWARSVRLMRPLDPDDRPLPYLPYCAIELLSERLNQRIHLLEFGAGYSTLFFMNRVAHVTALEHHAQWLEIVRARAAANVTLLPTSNESAESYAAPLRASDQHFDLILVDGRHRMECFALALERLTPAGVIVLYDSDRAQYAGAFPLAQAAGFRVLHLRGHKADSVDLHRTSFFYRDGNCLGL
ncbi:MAG: class I SAM-dependent methyltransferase [Longimicrobiales bacterium]